MSIFLMIITENIICNMFVKKVRLIKGSQQCKKLLTENSCKFETVFMYYQKSSSYRIDM